MLALAFALMAGVPTPADDAKTEAPVVLAPEIASTTPAVAASTDSQKAVKAKVETVSQKKKAKGGKGKGKKGKGKQGKGKKGNKKPKAE